MVKCKPVFANELKKVRHGCIVTGKEEVYDQLIVDWMFGTACLRKDVNAPEYSEQGVWTFNETHLVVSGTVAQVVQTMQEYQDSVIKQWVLE